ncbi:MAG: mechanosensitive ion channel family protein [Bryobacteraceae bacterium]|nr:mechanosensitive ion channel family protein [Bryobacteraceae bacterium]
MNRSLKALGSLCLASALTIPVACPQTPIEAAPDEPEAAPLPDRLGRNTPRGSVLGFVSAVQRRDFDRAAQYLDTAVKGDKLTEIAEQLAYVLNRSNLARVSDNPGGTSQDRLAPSAERIASLTAFEKTVHIELVNVEQAGIGIWLFSPQTLDNIPVAYEYLSSLAVNRKVPSFLARPMWLSVPLWKYLAVLGGFALSYFAVTRSLLPVKRFLRRWIADVAIPDQDRTLKRLSIPLGVLFWLLLAEIVVYSATLPLLARQGWFSVVTKVAVAVLAWLALAVIRTVAETYRWRVEALGKPQMTAIVRLAERTVQLLCIFFAVLIVCRLAGYDVTTILAGLGVGGLAVALAAQKSLENLFGGVSVILDNPIRVGDECKVGDRMATVVDIGMRSTRFRTWDRTIMTVPNGQLASMTLDNFSLRDFIWFRHVLGVRMNPSDGNLERLLEALRALFENDPQVDDFRRRIRLVRLDAQSADIELFCYIRTNDVAGFLAIQESLLLRCLNILDSHSVTLATPLQSVQISGAAG